MCLRFALKSVEMERDLSMNAMMEIWKTETDVTLAVLSRKGGRVMVGRQQARLYA